MPSIATKFWNVFDLDEDIEPGEIEEQAIDRIIDELYGILWRSHVIAPSTDMPRVVNQISMFADVSGYMGDDSFNLESIDDREFSLDAGDDDDDTFNEGHFDMAGDVGESSIRFMIV